MRRKEPKACIRNVYIHQYLCFVGNFDLSAAIGAALGFSKGPILRVTGGVECTLRHVRGFQIMEMTRLVHEAASNVGG